MSCLATGKKGYSPRPSSYPLLGPKYLVLGTIYPQLRAQRGSWAVLSLGNRRKVQLGWSEVRLQALGFTV